MDPHCYDFVYKFMPLNDNKIERVHSLLLEDNLWLSSPNDFNDPYDCAPVFIFDGSQEQKRAFISQLVSSKLTQPVGLHTSIEDIILSPTLFVSDLKQYFQEKLYGIGVTCFSGKNDSFLQWSHYSDSHKGICVRFRRDHLPNLVEVKYSDCRPVINMLAQEVNSQIENAVALKASCWNYEKEFRIIQHKHGIHRIPSSILDGIIFGARISAEHRKIITGWARERSYQRHVELWDAELSPGSFDLTFTNFG